MSIGEGNEFGCPWWSVVARVNYGSAREAMGAGFLVFGLCSLWGWWLLWRGVTGDIADWTGHEVAGRNWFIAGGILAQLPLLAYTFFAWRQGYFGS